MITILFGAGAEVDFGLSGGADFAKKVLGIESDELKKAVDGYLKHITKKYKDCWYPDCSSKKWEEEKIIEAALRKKFLDEEFNSKKKYDNKVKKEVKRLTKEPKKWQEIQDLIDQNTSYMGILDESFHTLINPRVLGPRIFWRVVECYTRAYVYLMGQMYNNDTKRNLTEKYKDILNTPNEVFERMHEFAKPKLDFDSYYKIIRNNDKEKRIRVVTTNYTTLCEEISGLCEDQVAHVHGKFGWFESAKKLQVFEVGKEELPKDILFPYIFVQSGVKPVVDEKQLREYAKMLNFFDDSQVLFIVGYRINYDDNHINSLIRSFLKKEKKVVFFDYDEQLGRNNVFKRLRLDNSGQLEYVKIGKKDCLKTFRDKLDEYQQERL